MEYPRGPAHGVMFHHFHGQGHPKAPGSISRSEFEGIIRLLDPRRILDPIEWFEKLEGGRLADADVCLTFDDALLCQFQVALPVLEEYNLRAFWFVYSCVFEAHVAKFELYRVFRCNYFSDVEDFYRLFFEKAFGSEWGDKARAVLKETEIARRRTTFPFYSVNDVKFRLIRDRALTRSEYELLMDAMIRERGLSLESLATGLWMTNEHLRYLSERGHVVGLHSYSHPMVLAELGREEQVREYERNYRHVSSVCGKRPIAMAHPGNSYSDETLEILGALGIRCGFRANMFPKGEGGLLNPSRLELAREDHANVVRML